MVNLRLNKTVRSLVFSRGAGGMKETFGNSGGEGGGVIFLHKNGNSKEVRGII